MLTSDDSERRGAALALARELGRVLAAYRLYPDDPEQPGFVAAVEGVRNACEVALAVGAVRFEVRSGSLYLGDEHLSAGEQVERLGRECFERRVEELVVRSLPESEDLVVLARVLSLPAAEVAERGGVQGMLDAAGVWAVAADEVRPDPEERDALLEILPRELAELFAGLDDPDRLATNLLVAGLPQNPATAAQDLFGRFGSLHDALPDDVIGRTGTLRRMRQVLELLPEGVKREFFATVVTKLDAAFATNYVNHLTDPELVDHLLRLGTHEGPEVGDVAVNLLAGTGRRPSVLSLLAERLRTDDGQGGSGTDEATSLTAMSDGTDPSSVRSNVADALGDKLVDEASGDLQALRELYPLGDGDFRTIARLAFRDYLRVEDRQERMELALAGWSRSVRQALRTADRQTLDELLQLVELDGVDPAKREMLRRARHAVVTVDVVADLVEPSDEVEPIVELLAPFEEAALGAVLDLLADEEDRARRAHLVGIAAGLTTDDRVQLLTSRLDDGRWFVVRNLVTILGRVASPEAATHLIALLDHPEPAVRREVIRSLIQSVGSDAVVHVRRAANDRDPTVRRTAIGALPGMRSDAAARALADIARHAEDHGDQQRAVELLASHPNQVKTELLRELASPRSKPRLPRSLRKLAKTAARDAERVS